MPETEGEAQQPFMSESIKDFTRNQRAKSGDSLHTYTQDKSVAHFTLDMFFTMLLKECKVFWKILPQSCLSKSGS